MSETEVIDAEVSETKPAKRNDFPALRQDHAMQLLKEQCEIFIRSKLLPDGMKWAEAFTIASYGREIGMKPLESIQDIYVVRGKPSMSAKLMKRLVHERLPMSRFDIIESSEEICTIEACRDRRYDKPQIFSKTRKDCDAAGFTSDRRGVKDNWKKQPKLMLMYRTISEVCRVVFPDCLGSAPYTPEELGADCYADGTPKKRVDGVKGVDEDSLKDWSQRKIALGKTVDEIPLHERGQNEGQNDHHEGGGFSSSAEPRGYAEGDDVDAEDAPTGPETS